MAVRSWEAVVLSLRRHATANGLPTDDGPAGPAWQVLRAEWHERLAGVPGATVAGRARHFEQAYRQRGGLGLPGPDTERLRESAARTLTDAGRQALARADLSWAEELYQRALSCSDRSDEWWTGALLGLGETLLGVGRTVEGTDLLTAALEVAQTRGDRGAAAHARLQLAALAPAGQARAAADAARAALPVFEAAGDRLGLARAHVRLGQQLQAEGRFRESELVLEEALGHAVAGGAAPEVAQALGALGVSLWQGPAPAALAIPRCVDLLAAHGADQAVVTMTLSYPLANLLALRGAFDRARTYLAAADRLAATLGYAEAAAFAPLFAAGVEVLADRPQAAEALLTRAVEQCRRIGSPALSAAAARELARLRLAGVGLPASRETAPDPATDPATDPASGAAVGAAVPLADLLAEAEQASQPGDVAELFGIRALAWAAECRLVQASVSAQRAVEAAQATDSPLTRAVAELDCARVYLAAGRPGEAGAAAARACAWYRSKGHLVGVGIAERLLTGAARQEQCPWQEEEEEEGRVGVTERPVARGADRGERWSPR